MRRGLRRALHGERQPSAAGSEAAAGAAGSEYRLRFAPLCALALLLGGACRGEGQTGEAPPSAPRPLLSTAAADQVRVALIAPGDSGKTGRRVACGDSAVLIESRPARPAPALEAALRTLLAMRERDDRSTGLLNPLYASRLELQGIDRQGAQATVRLSGYVELGDPCDNARLLAQLTETALQFPDLSLAQFTLDGAPLHDLLLGSPPAAPSPPASPAPPSSPPEPSSSR
ncbi:MAG TPA: GerMN domain-containing protein [Thermoanaerobaculia bacterium]|nr:GerMN domain-containing protein [Thermoanaerobaculia bacterium]